jgi:uncharacterized Zn finger protein
MARRHRYSRSSRYDGVGWGGFAPYVPVAARRAAAQQELRHLRKSGHAPEPVEVGGRTIATTFWGRAWCDNLEGYSDYSNRLPRGRTYVRNGSVIDLQIGAGRVDALVSGSEIYKVEITVSSVPAARWRRVCAQCAGGIDSLVELLQGRLSTGVMAHLCQQGEGLFPTPREITFECSCPDWASMCKHVAAVLYGVGARLDHRPELLFRLRQVDEADLVAHAGTGAALGAQAPSSSRVLAEGDLADVFGVEMAAPTVPPAGSSKPPKAPRGRTGDAAARAAKTAAAPVPVASPPGPAKGKGTGKGKPGTPPAPKRSSRPRFTAAERRAASERMKRYWAERTKKTKKA